MSAIRAPTYPSSANTSIAARSIRSRVAAAFSLRVPPDLLTALILRRTLSEFFTNDRH